ncbi:hypothetical protein EVAR_53391_1 [Eumeta japonica]|uniref:Uncharacterized protein n=1 Tax=Eumeta variegata TaxID=151549 RepID=A0A4C1Y4F8_EUMVA|nr:hypothetical protein EVAR_53391_1 [Eumeta japonica]
MYIEQGGYNITTTTLLYRNETVLEMRSLLAAKERCCRRVNVERCCMQAAVCRHMYKVCEKMHEKVERTASEPGKNAWRRGRPLLAKMVVSRRKNMRKVLEARARCAPTTVYLYVAHTRRAKL